MLWVYDMAYQVFKQKTKTIPNKKITLIITKLKKTTLTWKCCISVALLVFWRWCEHRVDGASDAIA